MENIDQETIALKLVEILYRQGTIDAFTYQQIKTLSRLRRSDSTA